MANPIDSAYGTLNEAQMALMELLNPQWMNIFEILIYPQDLLGTATGGVETSVADKAIDAAMAAIDTVIARLHIQKMSIPQTKFVYESFNGMKHIKDVEHPENITITFIENEFGLVRNYLQYWMKSIADVNLWKTNDVKSLAALGNNRNIDPALSFSYVFNDNQQKSKRNAKIFPQMKNGLPSTGGFIQLEGLKYESIENMEFDQASGEPMLITATFAVDIVTLVTPSSFIPA